MSTPTPESREPDKPRPDDLAGTPACLEEHHPTIRVRESHDTHVAGHPGVRLPSAPPSEPARRPPTADDLAGIPVCAEGDEHLIARPRIGWKEDKSF